MTRTAAAASEASPSWTTPAILRLALFTACAATALGAVGVLTFALHESNNLRAVSRELTPAMEADARLHDALVAMDRAAASEIQNGAADEQFDSARRNGLDGLLSAAESVSGRNSVRTELHDLGRRLDAYFSEVQRGRDARQSGNARWAESYRRAADLMKDSILPAEEALEHDTQNALGTSLTQGGEENGNLLGLVSGSGMLLVVVLVVLQIFLAARMRRLLNAPLFAATALAVICSAWFVSALGAESARFQTLVAGSWHTKPMSPRELKQRVEGCLREVASFEWESPAAAIGIAALTLAGIRPRLREYAP